MVEEIMDTSANEGENKEQTAPVPTIKPKSDRTKQLEALQKILRLINTELQLIGDLNATPIVDLNASAILGGVFASFMNYMRKKTNTTNSINGVYTAKMDTVPLIQSKAVTYAQMLEKVNELDQIKLDWRFLMPYMNNWSAFRLYYDEVRNGLTTWNGPKTSATINPSQGKGPNRKRKRDEDHPIASTSAGAENQKADNIEKRKLAHYNLNGNAIPFLRGITIKPERRSGMLKTMGPLALALALNYAKNYKEKIEEALEESISHLPFAKHIVSAISNEQQPIAFATLLSALNRCLVITTDRSPQKVHFPTAIYLVIEDFTTYDLSGKGAHYTYDQLVQNRQYFIKSKGTNGEKFRQAIFHSIFGTYTEDLGLLEQVTDVVNWFTRQELNEIYAKDKTNDLKTDNLPKWIRKSKMKSANITSFGAGAFEQTCSAPCTSGHQVRFLSEEVLKFARDGGREKNAFVETSNIINLLHNYALLCETRFSKQGETRIGTTDWATGIELVEGKLKWTGVQKDVFEGTGKFFFTSGTAQTI